MNHVFFAIDIVGCLGATDKGLIASVTDICWKIAACFMYVRESLHYLVVFDKLLMLLLVVVERVIQDFYAQIIFMFILRNMSSPYSIVVLELLLTKGF